jgi:hypothetical protein
VDAMMMGLAAETLATKLCNIGLDVDDQDACVRQFGFEFLMVSAPGFDMRELRIRIISAEKGELSWSAGRRDDADQRYS